MANALSPGGWAFSVVDFLRNQIDFSQLRLPIKSFHSYLAAHCQDLLDYALSEADFDLGSKAFVLLSMASRTVVKALVEADLFFVKATEVLASQNVSSVIVNRLSTLLNTIIVKQRSGYTESIGFLIQLLRFVEEPCVFAMFTSICSASPKLTALQSVVASSNFASLILAEFGGDSSTEKLANLCAIVRVCLKNPTLESEFSTDACRNTLFGLLDRDDLILRNQLWQALSSLCNQTTFAKMEGLRQPAVATLQTCFSGMHMYHVCAFDFIGKYLYFAPDGFSDTEELAIFNIMLRAMIEFPDATNLITSMFRFLRTALKSDLFQDDILGALVPILIVFSEANERTAIGASSREFLADIEVYRTKNKEIHRALLANLEYREYLSGYLKKYIEDLKVPYGGPISRYVPKPESIREMLKRKLQGGSLFSDRD
jgi:hypothetical protein